MNEWRVLMMREGSRAVWAGFHQGMMILDLFWLWGVSLGVPYRATVENLLQQAWVSQGRRIAPRSHRGCLGPTTSPIASGCLCVSQDVRGPCFGAGARAVVHAAAYGSVYSVRVYGR